MKQQNLFETTESYRHTNKFISEYRISLVRDRQVTFNDTVLMNSVHAHGLFTKIIETQGQTDREQFVVVLLNAKNHVIGYNIVATGCLTSATVHPREVLKPAILSNAAAMIFCHNHPSGDCNPSDDDIELTKRLIVSANYLGIHVHEHIIISMSDDKYYSFADHGIIADIYKSIKTENI
jgi:DNA repair protein RadC